MLFTLQLLRHGNAFTFKKKNQHELKPKTKIAPLNDNDITATQTMDNRIRDCQRDCIIHGY